MVDERGVVAERQGRIELLPAEADDRVVDALGLLVALADRLVLGAAALAHLESCNWDYWQEADCD